MRNRRKEWFDLHGPCEACGSWIGLEVHHVNPETKVSHRVWSWSKKRRDAELAKCVVLCFTCHHATTFKLSRFVPDVSPEGELVFQVIDFGSANGDRTRTLRLERE